jgi:hypothetical protein
MYMVNNWIIENVESAHLYSAAAFLQYTFN